jgi:hypothetical protein
MGLFIVGHLLAWFQLNSQFVWGWWREHPVITVAVYALPIGLCFLFGTRLVVGETGTLWSSRFLAFSASYLAFPVLTWYFLNESMFTAKTLICTFLSCLIIAVQLFWK